MRLLLAPLLLLAAVSTAGVVQADDLLKAIPPSVCAPAAEVGHHRGYCDPWHGSDTCIGCLEPGDEERCLVVING